MLFSKAPLLAKVVLLLAVTNATHAEEGATPRRISASDIAGIAEAWKDRVFLVVADGGPCRASLHQVRENPKILYRKRRVGCAVYLGEGRLLLTTASVVRLPPSARPEAEYVEVFNDRGQHALARVIGRDPFLDVALLEASEDLPAAAELPPLELGEEPAANSACMVLGSAFGRSLSATIGTIGDSIEIIPNGMPIRVHRVNAQIYPGDSGGPVLDIGGRFLGIVTAAAMPGEFPAQDGIVGDAFSRELRLEAASDAGFAVPARSCEWAWNDLRRFGRVRRAYLGVEMSVADEGEGGARVLNVMPGSSAEAVGIRPGDIITMFGGRSVSTPREFCALVAATSPNVRVDIRLVRADAELAISLSLPEASTPPRIRRLNEVSPARESELETVATEALGSPGAR